MALFSDITEKMANDTTVNTRQQALAIILIKLFLFLLTITCPTASSPIGSDRINNSPLPKIADITISFPLINVNRLFNIIGINPTASTLSQQETIRMSRVKDGVAVPIVANVLNLAAVELVIA